MNNAFLFQKFQNKQKLCDKPNNQIDTIKGHVSITERMTIDVLHRDKKFISPTKAIIVPDNIGMIQASLKNFRLFFHLFHIEAIIITVKLKLYLNVRLCTFLTANKDSPICTLRTFPNEPAPMQPSIFIVIILTCGKFNDEFFNMMISIVKSLEARNSFSKASSI